MPGFATQLPLVRDPADGYKLIKDYKQMIKQNIKMVVLTNPGERIMNPLFGVGLKKYLFMEKSFPSIGEEIKQAIFEQVSIYVEKAKINFIDVRGIGDELENTNILNVTINFSIPMIANSETLEIQISSDTNGFE